MNLLCSPIRQLRIKATFLFPPGAAYVFLIWLWWAEKAKILASNSLTETWFPTVGFRFRWWWWKPVVRLMGFQMEVFVPIARMCSSEGVSCRGMQERKMRPTPTIGSEPHTGTGMAKTDSLMQFGCANPVTFSPPASHSTHILCGD